MRKSNKKVGKMKYFILGTLSLFLVGGFLTFYYKTKMETFQNENVMVSHTKNLLIQNIRREQNSENQEVLSFTYKILPEEANNQTIQEQLSWSDETVEEKIEDYLSYKNESSIKTITITCLQKADYQAKLSLISKDNPNAKAVVRIDFNKDFLGYTKDSYPITHRMNSFDDLTISKKQVLEKVKSMSKGFGKGSRYKDNQTITNFIIEPDRKNAHSYLTNYYDENDDTQLMYKDAILGPDFISSLGSGISKKLSEYFIDSDAESDLKNADVRDRDLIADFTDVVFLVPLKVTFNFYGEAYQHTVMLRNQVSTEIFEDYTIIGVSGIEVSTAQITF